MNPRLTLCFAVLSLAGCAAVGPNYQPPAAQALPAQYLEPAGSADLRAVWRSLTDDPLLRRLQQAAVAQGPDLAQALARLAQSRAQQSAQDAATGPSLAVAARASDDRISRNGEMFANLPPALNPKSRFVNEQIGFDASWEIDLFGYQRRVSEGAAARSQAAADRADDVRLMLAAEVARNYFELRVTQQRIALLRAELAEVDEAIAITKVAVAGGEFARTDLRRAELLRDNLAAGLPALELAARRSLAALMPLTALPLPDLNAMLGAPRDLPPVPEAPAAGLPGELLRRRPDLRAAERDRAAASADVGVAVAARYPRFSLLGQGGWQSVHSGRLLDPASLFWSAGPQLSLPLFESGRLQAQVQASEAALAAADAAWRKTALAAVADAEVALTRVARGESRRAELLRAEQRQADLLALAEQRFRAGDASRLELIEARRALQQQREQTVQAQGDSLTAMVALVKALGGAAPD